MLSLKKIVGSLRFLKTNRVCYNFSGDKWRDRDEASEKVYITQQ